MNLIYAAKSALLFAAGRHTHTLRHTRRQYCNVMLFSQAVAVRVIITALLGNDNHQPAHSMMAVACPIVFAANGFWCVPLSSSSSSSICRNGRVPTCFARTSSCSFIFSFSFYFV